MKIRNGFVSNSSSSSFVLITTKEHYEETLSKFPKEMEVLLDEIGIDEITFDGKQLVKFGYVIGNYSTFEEIEVEISKEGWKFFKEKVEYPEELIDLLDADIDENNIPDDEFPILLFNCVWQIMDVFERALDKDKVIIHSEDF